jgi:hypothetical protein
MTITARQVAVDVLNRSRSRDGFAAELVDDALATANLSAQDRRFVTQLVFGVIRRSGTLEPITPLPNQEELDFDWFRVRGSWAVWSASRLSVPEAGGPAPPRRHGSPRESVWKAS